MNPTDTRVTWLLPVKNGLPYLEATLESLAAQNYASARVLAWDNASDDGTVELLREWIPARLPGEVIADRPMKLLADALAAMVEHARSEYCARIDADDIAEPERLKKQTGFLDENPDIALLGTDLTLIDENGTPLDKTNELNVTHETIVPALLRRCPVCHPSWLFRREAVLAVGNYRHFGRRAFEDNDLLIRLACRGYRLANLSEPLLRYRVHTQSETFRAQAEEGRRTGPPNAEPLLNNAEDFLGMPRTQVEAAFARHGGFKPEHLRRIARHLAGILGLEAGALLRSEDFQKAAIHLLPPDSHLDRARIAATARDWPVARNQLGRALKRLGKAGN